MTQSSTETKDPLIGQSIDHGRYELLRIIGEGGMGKVYEARQKRVDRLVAVKVLHSHWAKDPKLVARFKREALTASQFRHPNTVMIYDYGETTNGDLYIIMELLKGQSLLSLLDKEGPLSLDRALKIIDQICGAVTEVHRCGVIHRDLKPENIQIDPRDGHPDFVKLLDFSIAKLVNDNTLSSMDTKQNLTLQGAVFGTPQYMSPEQVRGRSLDQRTDLYAIGVIFYQMLSGFVPFSEPTPQGTMMAHLTESVPRFEEKVPHLDIHPAAAQLIYDCLEKDPQNRIESSDVLTQRIMELRFTLQREEELNAEPDTDLGTPQVTSRLTSATSKDLNTEEQAAPLNHSTDKQPAPPHHSENLNSVTSTKENDESSLPLKTQQRFEFKDRKLSSALGKNNPIKTLRPAQLKKSSLFTSPKEEILESDIEEERGASTEETQEFNPALHGTLEGNSPITESDKDTNPQSSLSSDSTSKPSITSAVTMGVEELTELDQDLVLPSKIEQDTQEQHDLNDLGLGQKDQMVVRLDSLKSDSKNILEGENKTDEQQSQEVPVLKANTINKAKQEQDQSQIVKQAPTGSSVQVTESEIETKITNTDELHAVDDHKDLNESKVNSATQELNRVEPNQIKETLPLYGLQAAELINAINDESVANSTIDSEQVSTGLFEPLKPQRQFGLSIALVSAIALIVFVTLNPHLLQKLNASFSPAKAPAKKIKLGAAQLELNYYLTAEPKGQVYDRLTGKLLGETPLSWEKNDAKFSESLFEVRADGHNSQIVSLAGFKVSAKDPNRRELHLQLKLAENTHNQDITVDQENGLKTKISPDEDITNVGKARSKKKKKQNKNRKASSTPKRTKRIKKSKAQAKRPNPKPNETKSRLIKQLSKRQDSPKKSPSPKETKRKVPELLKLSPNEPVDPARFKDSIEVEKLP